MNSKTELVNRIVWFDGTNQIDADMVPELFLHGVKPDDIAVNKITADIKKFNQLADVTITDTKVDNKPFSYDWQVPAKYFDIDLKEFSEDKLKLYSSIKQVDIEVYNKRLTHELKLIDQFNMGNLFKTLIYVLDKLKETNTVWGVGRGSSCASLVLFLIGIHKVDPVKFGIPANEFFHD